VSQVHERHEYKNDFYEYINAGSLSSAREICPTIVSWLKPKSLLDIGCGAGAWCRIWMEQGVQDVLGVDGDYVDRQALLIPQASFRSHDLSKDFDAGRRFDLVTSLEVAEHVPTETSATFVDNLVRHGDFVMFSAAVPGQGGEFHVNEQPLEFWRELFVARGYRCFDPLRPLLSGNTRVEPWYRYNTLLYVAESAVAELPPAVRNAEIGPGTAIPERAPLSWQARNALLRSAPKPVLDLLVRLKHSWGRLTRPHR